MRSRALVLLVFMLIFGPSAVQSVQAQAEGMLPEPTATAPVVVDGKVLFVLRGISSYPAEVRASDVRSRIIEIAKDGQLDIADLHIESEKLVTRIELGDRLVMALVGVDAEIEGVDLDILAVSYMNRISEAITEYRNDRSRDRLLRNGGFAVGATLVLVLALWGVLRLFDLMRKWAERRIQKSIRELASKTYHLFHAGRLWGLLSAGLQILRLVAVLTLVYFYLNAVLGLFPWTRPFALTLLTLVLNPLKSLGAGFLGALPDLFFLLILFFVVRYLLKLIRSFFEGLRSGRIHFEKFDADWAMPTFKIIRILVVAFSVVIAYPYIPGSDSLAFKGVSVFLGVLLSLGSSSFIANTIAGLTMTYRGAFKEGDVVRIDDVTGRVVEIKLMVTRIRTPKNESVVLPNSNILNTNVVNYSTLAQEQGVVLHTTVSIGYDVPWRQVEAMLVEAAGRTEGLEPDPPPFVRQADLGDFAVTYELNAFCKSEGQMPMLYSALHANIQDVFNENDVQIMSPHYENDPGSPKVVPPERWYTAPARNPG